MDAILLSFAHRLADMAGDVIRPYFGAHGEVSAKGDQSPVTCADREAEMAMRRLIAETFPEHGIYGEEFGQESCSSHRIWVIDPIDGTRAFIAGRREWGTLIALCENGVPILGILDQPVTGERWLGVRGAPTIYFNCLLEGTPDRTRPCAALSAASISTTSMDYFTAPQAEAFATIAQQCRTTVIDGDCYAYGLLALGRRDVVIDAGLQPYDILALVPIIEGAGGIITGWDGAAVTLTHYADVVAAGDAARHREMLDILYKAL